MKRSAKDRAEGKLRVMKGKLKEKTGRLVANPALEEEGKDDQVGGKMQQVLGNVEEALGA